MRFFFSKLCTIFWRIMRPKSWIMRELCELRNIFKRKILIVLIYYPYEQGFFKTNWGKNQRKQQKREKERFFAAKSKRALFSFPSCHWVFSSNHGACCIKSRAHAPNGQQHRTPGMPCLVERFSQRSGGYLLRKCTVFMEKTAIHLSRYEKSIAYK